MQLLDFGRGEPVSFVYVYDFGDGWDHLVEFEGLLVLEPAPRVATCLDGARARPPEDVGGVPGYERFLAILADLQHPEHRELKRWAGGRFDPEWFDREGAIATCARRSGHIGASACISRHPADRADHGREASQGEVAEQ